MANPRESKLRIIRDIVDPGIPTHIRVARVASPLLNPISLIIEAEKFRDQHHPDDLSVVDIKQLTDTRGDTIGGAIIWEATWFKMPETQARKQAEEYALEELRRLMGEELAKEQGHRLNYRLD